MEPKVKNFTTGPLVPLHQLKHHKIDVGEFLTWANSEGFHTEYVAGITGFRQSTINTFQAWVNRQVPKKFENQIQAIKFMREMIADRRDGLKDCKEFVDAVFRTPSPANFVH